MGHSPSRNLVTPTGTMATLATPGYISDSSRRVRSRAGPSFTPGQETIWQFMVMLAAAKRRITSMLSPARLFFSISTRSWGSVVCTETLMGLICRSIMRWTSRLERFVKVR